jgi:hypothetical protein
MRARRAAAGCAGALGKHSPTEGAMGAASEKGGKPHAMPCHHNLEEYLTAYLDGAGLRDDPEGPCSARSAAAPPN